MKAAVLKHPGVFELEEVNTPECPPGGLLIKVHTSAICSADVKMIQNGHRALRYPRIPGHETTGVVIESRALSTAPGVGERVQVAPGISCQACSYCRKGVSNQCRHIEIIGFTLDGGFAEYLAVSSSGIKSGVVTSIPDNLSFEQAVLAEPVACCLNGQKLAGVGKGDTVLVLGAGPIGCIQAVLSRYHRAGKVLLGDTLAERLILAGPARADRLIDLSKELIKEVVAEETEGFGVDIIFLACPEAASAYPILQLLASRGKVCLFSGLPKDKANLPLDMNLLHYLEAMVVGAYGCTVEQNKAALEIMSGGVDVNWLISNKISLEQIKYGMELVADRKGLKTLIQMGE